MTHTQKRIYITQQIPELAIRMLKEKGYDVVVGKNKGLISQKEIISVLKKAEKKGQGFDALITLLTDKIDVSILNAGVSLEVIANYAIGYDNIDVSQATGRGIVVTNAPGEYVSTLAEHVVAITLAVTSRIVEADRYMRAGKYKGWDPMLFIGTDVSHKTIGLIGAGRIGTKVAHFFAQGLNSDIVYFDTKQNEEIEKKCGAKRVSTIDELIAQADIISLHVPLLPTTRHMVDATFLKKMKKTAYIINTSRGAVIDEVALVHALKKKEIAGAALDVFEFEPKLAKGLSKLDTVVLTPHIASASEHARNEMARVTAQNVIDVFEGGTPVGNITA